MNKIETMVLYGINNETVMDFISKKYKKELGGYKCKFIEQYISFKDSAHLKKLMIKLNN